MARQLILLAAVGAVAGSGGCAGTWDNITSRKFRDAPFKNMFGKEEDPLHVLRTSPEGGERAAAMRRLKEPAVHGNPADQDEVLDHVLGPAATTDPSPVVRAAAVEALGRFQDPRAVRYLTAAYHQASGRPADAPRPVIRTAGATGEPGLLGDRLGLHGPSGFPVEATVMLRGKVIDALARSGKPEAVTFLTRVAAGDPAPGEEPTDRDTRMAAVRGLGTVRQKEAVVALARVLAAEKGKDVAMAGRAHDGLVSLTGKSLPPDPAEWSQVVQAGFDIAPEPTGLQRTAGWISTP